jgi:hypothetical protein
MQELQKKIESKSGVRQIEKETSRKTTNGVVG